MAETPTSSTNGTTADHRSRLILAMAELLGEASLQQITIADVVRTAKVSKRTFYEQFNSKEECFIALYYSNSAKMLGELGRSVPPASGNWLQDLNSATTAFLEVLKNQGNLMRRLYIDALSVGAEGLTARRVVNEQFAEILTQLFNQRLAARNIPHKIDKSLVLAITAGINEMVLYAYTSDNDEPDMERVANVTRDIYRAIIIATALPYRRDQLEVLLNPEEFGDKL